jgi:hypothetical protein
MQPETVGQGQERAEARTVANARLLRAVRNEDCELCCAPAHDPCQVCPAADHLARWVAAYTAGVISRDDLAAVIDGLVVITAQQLISERAA